MSAPEWTADWRQCQLIAAGDNTRENGEREATQQLHKRILNAVNYVFCHSQNVCYHRYIIRALAKMQVACDNCGNMTELPEDRWWKYCTCDDVLLGPITPGMKYCKYNNTWVRVLVTKDIMQHKGDLYPIDNKVVETRCGEMVYGATLVVGFVKERLLELSDVKEKLLTAETDLETKDEQLESKERDQEAKKDIRDKENPLGGMRTTLTEKETALTEAIGKVKECEAEIGHQMVKNASKMTEMETKLRAAEDRAKKSEEELRLFKKKENDKVEKTEEMARDIGKLQEDSLSTANDKLEDAVIMTDFRKQQSIQNEQLLTDQKNTFNEYTLKIEQKMEEQARLHQDQMADQERGLLEKHGKLQQEMEKLAKHYKKKMLAQGKSFLEQKDSLQKSRDDLSAANADLKRQNEILIMTIAKMAETAGTSKVDGEKTMEREKKEGRADIGGGEKMEEEV